MPLSGSPGAPHTGAQLPSGPSGTGHNDLDGVHFVEVKTRRPPLQADPQECVTFPKQRRLVKAALAYLSKQKDPHVRDCECHFDVAAVVIDGERTDIQYYPEAFIPIYY